MARTAADLESEFPNLKEVCGVRDAVINLLLEQLRAELTERPSASGILVEGVAQTLAVHLVRNYRDESFAQRPHYANVLPAFRFLKVEEMMKEALEEGIHVGALAVAVGMNEAQLGTSNIER